MTLQPITVTRAAWAVGAAILPVTGTWMIVVVAKPDSALAAARWRWWLSNRVTTRGAKPHNQPWRGICSRCGDQRGRHHECRDESR